MTGITHARKVVSILERARPFKRSCRFYGRASLIPTLRQVGIVDVTFGERHRRPTRQPLWMHDWR